MMPPLLSVENLTVSFHTYAGEVEAVRDVSFTLDRGEVLAIVGEAGSGKSVTVQAILGLVPIPPARIKSGSARLDGVDLLSASEAALSRIRGKEISMIFQDPMTALNPSMRSERRSPRSCSSTRRSAGRRRGRARSSSSAWSAFPSPRSASTSTRTSSPAACASAS